MCRGTHYNTMMLWSEMYTLIFYAPMRFHILLLLRISGLLCGEHNICHPLLNCTHVWDDSRFCSRRCVPSNALVVGLTTCALSLADLLYSFCIKNFCFDKLCLTTLRRVCVEQHRWFDHKCKQNQYNHLSERTRYHVRLDFDTTTKQNPSHLLY